MKLDTIAHTQGASFRIVAGAPVVRGNQVFAPLSIRTWRPRSESAPGPLERRDEKTWD